MMSCGFARVLGFGGAGTAQHQRRRVGRRSLTTERLQIMSWLARQYSKLPVKVAVLTVYAAALALGFYGTSQMRVDADVNGATSRSTRRQGCGLNSLKLFETLCTRPIRPTLSFMRPQHSSHGGCCFVSDRKLYQNSM